MCFRISPVLTTESGLWKQVSLFLFSSTLELKERTELEKLKFIPCSRSWCLSRPNSLVHRGTEGHRSLTDVDSFLAKENFLVLVNQGQIPKLKAQVREVILFQGFTLSFATIITWGGGEAVWLNVWHVKPQSSCLMLETPSELLRRCSAIISVRYAKSTALIMWRLFKLILCLSPIGLTLYMCS